MDVSGDIIEHFPGLEKYENLPPCPKCGSPVEWSNCRDIEVLSSAIYCTGEVYEWCDLRVFQVEGMAFMNLESVDYLTTIMKYCQWASTKPESYCGDTWTHYTKK